MYLSGYEKGNSMKRLVMIAFLLILSAGCVGMLRGGSEYSDIWANQIRDRVAIYDPDDVGVCGDVECYVMVCENSSNYWGTVTSFVGGNCRVQSLAGETPIADAQRRMEVSRENFNELWNDSERGVQNFMIGIGPSFADFGEGNRWCNNKMSMAVQWLVGGEDYPYPDCDEGRAICLLDRGVMPVYVLYSGGELDDEKVDSAGKIAETLYEDGASFITQFSGPVGPVIITTEMDANLTDPQVRDNVLGQAEAIKANCPDGNNGEKYCMVALGSKMGDYEGLELALSDSRADNIDFVAFGINSNRADSCNYNDIYIDAWSYSRFSWYDLDKPTIIPYILFDSEGEVYDENGDYVCSWSEGEMVRAYRGFFPNLMVFKDSGVIGAAPYDFNSTWIGFGANPMGCSDCSLGKNTNRLTSWFAGCQRTTGIYRVPEDCTGCDDPNPPLCCEGVFSQTVGIPLVLPNQTGGGCNFAHQGDSLMNLAYGSGLSNSFLEYSTGDLHPPMDKMISCDSCMHESREFPFADDIPSFTIASDAERDPTGLVPGVSLRTAMNFPELTGLEIACQTYPELDHWAGVRNIDPMYVRAVAMTESGLDPCSTACSPKPRTSHTGCIPGNYGKGYNMMEDPSGECNDVIDAKSPDIDNDPGDSPDYRVMGLGLMQVLNAPYTFWPREFCDEETPSDCGEHEDHFLDTVGSDQIEDREDLLARAGEDWRRGDSGEEESPERERYSRAGRNRAIIDIETVKDECGSDFNPYNASDSACLGTYIIELDLETADRILDRIENRFSRDILEIRGDSDRRGVLQYYIASHLYFGSWKNSWLYSYDMRYGFTNEDCTDELGLGVDPIACEDVGDMREESGESGCWGTTSLIDYVHRCGRAGRNDPGYNKLGYYRALTGPNGCPNSACPSWINLYEAGDFREIRGEPEDGNPYQIYGDGD